MEGQHGASVRIWPKGLGGSSVQREGRGEAREVGMWDVNFYFKSSRLTVLSRMT